MNLSIRILLTTLVAALAGCANAGAAIIVSDPTALSSAVKNAKGGETIELAAGEYGRLDILNRTFAKPLVITSRDPAQPASLTIAIAGSAGVTLRALKLGRALEPGEPEYTQLNNLDRCKDILFDRINFHGSLDGDASNDAWGLYVVNSDGVTITGSEFEQLTRAYIFDRSRNIVVSHNDFHNIRSDAGDFAAVENVTVDSNSYTDFHPTTGDHPDAIQFWTNGQTQGSSNIRITNNRVLQGSGPGVQGIFIRDEVGTLPFHNILIENNLLYSNDQWEGISIEHADSVTVSGNSLMSSPDDDKTLWIRLDKVSNGNVFDNVADRIIEGTNPSVEVKNNTLLTGAESKHVKVNLRAGPATTWRDLVVDGLGFRPPADLASSPK